MSERDGLWIVYLLRCRDGALYCGITNDFDRRMRTHARGKGSKYVFSRRPFSCVYQERQPDKSSALRREVDIKRMPASAKRALADSFART
jgi:putative endonuclease